MCKMEKYIENVNVLLVDDRPENLLALEAVLGDLDYNLIRAYSGEEALKCLLKDDFAVILLDVQMPGLNGFETARIIKSRPKTRDTPIIFITAISKAPENVFTGYSVGAIDYLFKPFEPDILKSKIESLSAIHRNKRGLEEHTELLIEKTQSLEKANQELTEITLKLKRAEALTGIIRNTSIDAMITYNESFEIITVNPATKQMFGYDEEYLIGKKIMQIVPATVLAIELGHELGKRYEVTGVRNDSSTFPAEVQLGSAAIDNHNIYACTIRDISELKSQMTALAHQALHDSLTSLPNRSLLYDRLEQGIIAAKNEHNSFALILIDLNHFKVINDTLGHHFGDLLLQQVGNRLSEIVKVTDTVARLGGDEFALYLPTTTKEQTLEIAKQVLNVMEQPFVQDDHVLSISLSQGIVFYPDHGDNVQTLMKKADISMYTAKRKESGYCIFSSELDTHTIEELSLVGDLREAIDNDGLELYYQPQVEMKSKKVTGVEVLLRWIHPSYGFIAPDRFIPIAEQNGLMKKLTVMVLEKALQQSKKWLEKGVELQISVNLSASNLQDMQLSEDVQMLLNKYNMNPQTLTLEITESFIMSNPTRAREILQSLSSMGIKLSIDDFGTGYSSLAYLKNLPVNEIKVDKSFVIDMLQSNSDEIIVRTVINLAHNLGLKVVAEGIESKEVWDNLQAINCNTAQGYYLSKPVPAESFYSWYVNHNGVFAT